MFKTRLLSGIVLVIAALVLIITGGDVLLISTLIISYIGMFELYRIFHKFNRISILFPSLFFLQRHLSENCLSLTVTSIRAPAGSPQPGLPCPSWHAWSDLQ